MERGRSPVRMQSRMGAAYLVWPTVCAVASGVVAIPPATAGDPPPARVWFQERGETPDPLLPIEPTQIHMPPGACKTLVLWVADPAGEHGGDPVMRYSVRMPIAASGGAAGEVSYLDLPGDCNTAMIDVDHPDYIYKLFPLDYVPECEEGVIIDVSNDLFTFAGGVTLGPESTDIPNPGGANYLAEFTYCASADACGTFDLVPESSFLANGNPGGPPLSLEWLPVEVFVVDNDDCNKFLDLDGASVVVPYSTSCASVVVGPTDCAEGVDTWYRYTAPEAGPLTIRTTGPGTMSVYNVGTLCPPPQVLELACGACDGCVTASAGQEFLIRISGADAEGLLFINPQTCSTDDDCADIDPCTSDEQCVEGVCFDVPEDGPCDDGNSCTVGDYCAQGVCLSGAVIACDDGNDCTVDVCVPGMGCESSEVNGHPCVTNVDCNSPVLPGVDGAGCVSGECIWPAPGDRALMDAAGNLGAGQPLFGLTSITMLPGTTRRIDVLMSSTTEPTFLKLSSYQIVFQILAQPQAGAEGTVSYVDNDPGMEGGGSMLLDTSRSDFVFAYSIALNPPVYLENGTNEFTDGVIYNTAIALDNVYPRLLPQPSYLAEFEITASADACGQHLFVWNLPINGGVPPLAAFFARSGVPTSGVPELDD